MSLDNITCPACGRSNKSSFRYCAACGAELPRITPKVAVKEVEQPRKKSGTNKILLVILGAAAIVAGLGSYALYDYFNKHSLYDTVLIAVAAQVNKTCPMMVDKETRLDNVASLKDNVFQYNYTLIHIKKGTIDTAMVKQQLEPTMINVIKTNPEMKIYRDHKTTLKFCYKDMDGEAFFVLSITPDKYE